MTKQNVSDIGFCLRLQVKPTQCSPIDRASPYLLCPIDWAQLSRFYLKTETESSLQIVVFCNIKRTVILDKDRTMDNVQKYNIYSNVPSSQILHLIYTKYLGSFLQNHI
jgi:hypothetical protein